MSGRRSACFFDISSHSVCTAFCVAADVVATAGHCLYRTNGREAAAPVGPLASSCTGRTEQRADRRRRQRARAEPNVHLRLAPGSTSIRPSTRRTTGRSCGSRSRSARRGACAVSRQPVAEVMKLAANGQRVPDRLSPRLAEVAADARTPAAACGAIFDDADWSTIRARLLRPRPAPAAHLRHRRRLVGLAAADRRARRPGGRRHQRRHLRAVEGDHAERRGAAPLQVGRRRQHRRQRARLRRLARHSSAPIR